MAKRVISLVRRLVRDNLLPTSLVEAAGQGVEAFLSVELAVLGWDIGARDSGEDLLRGACKIAGLPSSREVVVPVLSMGLRPGQLGSLPRMGLHIPSTTTRH